MEPSRLDVPGVGVLAIRECGELKPGHDVDCYRVRRVPE